jgi:molybdopterin-binding protein
MNRLIATVEDIKNLDNLNIITFKCNNTTLAMMGLELVKNIKAGKKVVLGCKPSSVAIAKNFEGTISYSNELPSNIVNLEVGELLSVVTLKYKEFLLESLITTKTLKRMDLKIGDDVTTFIKASELSIIEVLDD